MKRLIPLIVLLAGLLLVIGLASEVTSPALAGKPAQENEDILIVYVTPLLSMSPDWSRSHDAFMQAAEDYGFEGRVVGPNEINVEEMVADIETAIAEGADGIITCPLVPEAFEDVLQKAKDAGIPVVNVMADCCTDNRLTFIGTDPVALGQAYAEKIVEHSGGEAKVGIIMTDATTPNQKIELDNFTAAIDGTGVEIVDVQYDHSQVTEAQTLSQAMLTAHPEINYVVCLEGACPNGVGLTVEEMGLAGKVNVLAIDLQPGTIDYIKSGVIWASFTQSYYNIDGGGVMAADVLVNYWRDGTLPESFIDSGYNFWTVENVDEYGK
jgi:ribose transport system substrate-binding protein